MTTKRKQTIQQTDDSILVINTVEYERDINYADILAACEIVPDECMSDAPWDWCDGWKHHLTNAHNEADDCAMQGYVTGRRRGQHILVCDEPIDNLYCAPSGASRQVIAEGKACALRRFIAQLVDWYDNGWEWFGVRFNAAAVELDDIDLGQCITSLWGIDDYNFADSDCRHDVANEVCHSLEELGFTIVNRPVDPKRIVGRTIDVWREHWKRNLHSQDWS